MLSSEGQRCWVSVRAGHVSSSAALSRDGSQSEPLCDPGVSDSTARAWRTNMQRSTLAKHIGQQPQWIAVIMPYFKVPA